MSWEVEIDTPVPGTPGASGGLGVDDNGNIYAITDESILRWEVSSWVEHIGNAQGGYGLTIRPANGAIYYIYDDDGAFWKYENSIWAALNEPSGVDLEHGRSLAFGDENSDYDLYYLNVEDCICIYGANLNSEGRIPSASSWVEVYNNETLGDNLFGGMAIRGNNAYLVRSPEVDDSDRFGISNVDLSSGSIVSAIDGIPPATRGVGLAFYGNDLLRLGPDGKVYRFSNFDVLVDSPRRLTGEDYYYALHITYPNMTDIRIVADTRNHVIEGNEYQALAFRAVPPNFNDGEDPTAVLEIDNVGRTLTRWVDDTGGGRGAKMKVMQVRRGKYRSEIMWELPALPVGIASVTAQRVQVSLAYRSGRHRPAIKWRHTSEHSPGLF